MIDYSVMYKNELPLNGPLPAETSWDLFISAFTVAERVRLVYERVQANTKLWMLFPEYGLETGKYPEGAFVSEARDESKFIRDFWREKVGPLENKTVAIDITGFIRPYLVFLMRWLVESGVQRFDALYSEPMIYGKREKTSFSDEIVEEVRQIAGFEGKHSPDTSNDYLIIGSGYDHKLIAQVAENKEFSRKIQIFGLPSLRADMYQENVLNAYRAEEAVGRNTDDESSSYFAPANDPFVTATLLREIVTRINKAKAITNLYLSPLATKPQVLAFALYFLTERMNTATSLIFPFCRFYNPETTKGLSRIWKYTVELPQRERR
jgi:hypothetical protein